jgi:hypothetical protein
MKLVALSIISALAVMLAFTAGGTVHGQTGGTATATPTVTPTSTSSGPPPPPGGFGGGLTPPPAPGAATSTPTSTPTAVPTNTPIPLTLNVKLGHKTIKAGQKQSVKITALAGAHITLKISFPGGSWTYKKAATLGTSGVKTYSFKQPGLKKGAGNHTATVKVTATLNGQQKGSTKEYRVS